MKFQMRIDAVDPKSVPQLRLHTGRQMPCIGMGTFGSDAVSGETIAAAVDEALRVGYRLIDCAACYGNEHLIGAVFKTALEEGLPREELFVVSKLWNDRHAPKDVIPACKKSLADLRLEYLDCYLMHWPFPNYHAPGCDGDARNPESRPYIHEEFMATWREMEKLVDLGLVKSIGVSNVTIPKLELILRDARIMPVINEMELHPSFQQEALFHYCLSRGIQPIGYSPIGSPARPERDRTPEDVTDIELEPVVQAARAHGVHPAVICVKWAAQRGQIPIPFSAKRENLLANLCGVTEDTLTRDEMESLKSAECGCRLIKGQVFLWEGAESWLDLWDVDGAIPG